MRIGQESAPAIRKRRLLKCADRQADDDSQDRHCDQCGDDGLHERQQGAKEAHIGLVAAQAQGVRSSANSMRSQGLCDSCRAMIPALTAWPLSSRWLTAALSMRGT